MIGILQLRSIGIQRPAYVPDADATSKRDSRSRTRVTACVVLTAIEWKKRDLRDSLWS